MRSLILLSAVIALLAGYLDYRQISPNNSFNQNTTAKVIRNQPEPIQVKQSNQPITTTEAVANKLDLSLPSLDSIKQHYLNTNESMKNFFGQKSTKSISYNAELVFDQEKGESITGGKVNIKIPFG